MGFNSGFKGLISSHDAIFIVKFSLTFHYFRSIVTKYVAQILKLPTFFST